MARTVLHSAVVLDHLLARDLPQGFQKSEHEPKSCGVQVAPKWGVSTNVGAGAELGNGEGHDE